MKYLLINGSPHRGNTWKLAELVRADLIKQDTEAKFAEIHLMELELPFCLGCSNCFRKGYERCPHYEKVASVVKAIEQADGVIFASTTFNMRETALAKNLFDHLCFMIHRPHFFKSKALILTTTGGVGGMSAAKSISAMLKAIGFNRCYLFSCASISWNSFIPKEKTKIALSKKVDCFYRDIASGKLHSPSVMLLIPYNIFRGMSLAYAKGMEYETQDGVHWSDDSRKNSVYDKAVKVTFYKKPVGQLFYLIGKLAGKMVTVTYRK